MFCLTFAITFAIGYYDTNGNIETISLNDTLKVKYYYNLSNELIRENNTWLDQTITYNYDTNGNLLNKSVYVYTTEDSLGTPIYSNTNQYNDQNQLLSYNGYPVTYDANGNMKTFMGWTLTWTDNKLQQLIGNGNISYQYNSRNIRTSKTVNGVTTTYTIDSSNNVTSQTNGTDTLNYYYDSNGQLVYFTLNGTPYYYECNLQGDIIGILDGMNNEVVTYTYDSWGVLLSVGGSLAGMVGIKNPFRYRGYYYDTESGLYYLQSRYYNPEIGRFISKDDPSYCKGVDELNSNLYAYCENNPINRDDFTGKCFRDSKGNIFHDNWECGRKYDRGLAINYAEKYWNKTSHYFYSYSNGDCTNFTSQCLFTGGFLMSKEWHSFRLNKKFSIKGILSYKFNYNWDISEAWRLVNKQYEYIKKSSGHFNKEIVINKDTNIKNLISQNKIQKGDLIYFDKGNGKGIYHTAILNNVSSTMLKYAGHSINRWNTNITSFFKDFKKGKNYILLLK